MKTLVKTAFLTLLSLVIFNSVLLADGEIPSKIQGNIVKISGQVVDEITGETLAGVKLIIDGTNEVIYTDFDGEFQAQFDLDKNPEIAVSLISYEGKKIKIEGSNNLKIELARHK
jgi:hypothetical protein